MAPTPNIAIIGAGPTGCMLARLLHQAGIPVTVFEAEASPNYRSQGGTLDLHTSTGLAALKEANLFNEFLASARYDGHHVQFTDRHLKSYLTLTGPAEPIPDDDGTAASSKRRRSRVDEQRPEIDRSELRRILSESLPPDMIRWGHKVASFTFPPSPSPESNTNSPQSPSPSPSTPTIHFSSPSHPPSSAFTLIIGADGAFSRVRTALSPPQRPLFSRIGLYELSVPSGATTAPELTAAVKRGSIFAHADGRRISVQQMGDGSLSVGVVQAQEEEGWTSKEKAGFDTGDLEEVKRRLLEGEGAPFGADWHPLLREAVAKADRVWPRTLWQLPVGWRWEHREGVTLIGDAAHLMTPFAGEGVNVGLEDAMRLAREVVRAVKERSGDGEALDAAVRAYEEEMWPRSAKIAKLSDQLAKVWMFEPNSPEAVIARASALHVKVDQPRVVHPLVDVMVHGYFLFKRIMG